jgi:hypothetical protein
MNFAGKQFQERRFARAVWSENRNMFIGFDSEREIPQGTDITAKHRGTLNFDNGTRLHPAWD